MTSVQTTRLTIPVVPASKPGTISLVIRRTDLAMVFYDAAPNELRKRFKDTSLDGGVYTVTCDAFSHEEVTLANLTIEFAGYFGLEFDQDLSVSNVQFVPYC